MSDHEHIERRLHEAATDISVGTGLPNEVRRRVNLRRTATMATSVVAVVALAFGGAFAAGAFTSQGTELTPAQPSVSPTAPTSLFAAFDDGRSAEVGLDETAGTVCFLLPGFDDTEIVFLEIFAPNDRQSSLHPLDSGFGQEVPTNGWDVCRLIANREAVRAISASPMDYTLWIKDEGGDEWIARLSTSRVTGCGPSVDFRPTYLPEGWIEDLQVGSASEVEWRGLLGHYGNEQLPGTTSKADGGFADLMTGESPYALTGGERIRVLDGPARFGAIHEGFAVEFTQHECDYVLLGFGIEGDELRRFSEGLRLPGTYVEPSPGPNSEIESDGFALWPEDTTSEAARACADAGRDPGSLRRGPMETAISFHTQVLGWSGTVISRDFDGPDRTIEIRRDRDDQGRHAQGPAVRVLLRKTEPLCWSVVAVSNPANQPRRFEITVGGRSVEVDFDHLGADSVSYEVGHGMHTMTGSPVRTEGRIDIHLTYEPDEPGHFLLLFRDTEGVVFSAEGFPLPPGGLVLRR